MCTTRCSPAIFSALTNGCSRAGGDQQQASLVYDGVEIRKDRAQSDLALATFADHHQVGHAQESPVWMAPAKQDIFCSGWHFVRSGLVSGPLMRNLSPLALMVSANQAPFCISDRNVLDFARDVLVVAADWSAITTLVLLSRCSLLLS